MRTTRKSNRPRGRTAAVALTAVAALGVSLLSGCSKDSDDAAGGGGTSQGTDKSADKGELTLTVGTFGVFGYKQAGLYEEYEKAHPGITIKENVIERNDAYYPQLLTHLAAGSGLSDIQAIEVGNINEIVTTQAAKFEDLSKAAGVEKSNFLDWKWAQATTADGKTVGLGTDIGPMAICYRKDLFQKAGLPTDREAVGRLWAGDWQKYVDTGEQYTRKAPKGTTFLDSAAGLYQAVSNGAAERYYDSSGKVVYKTSPAVKNAWNLAMEAATGKMTAKLKLFDKAWDQGFANARFASLPCPSWMLGYIQEKSGAAGKGNWDVAAAPKPANWGGSFVGVPSAGKHKEEAVELAAWLTAPEQQAKVFAKQASFPSAPGAYDLPEVKDAKHEYFDDAPIGTIFADAAKTIPTLVIGPKDQQIYTAITDVGILQVEQQGKSPEQGWAAAEKEIDNALDQ
ncbi:extracellular solute-binding protein [Streptomyces sp. MI02-7b]|uniref:ABC transporter substrate-binding protein n=1 Tax=Streptomyces sp. MI02-7b TaxID=462941 RepID=UPI0029B30ED2|nr:extracellular solute-binding protein [Streptomyces sp. MI02-7b]MDX3074711.1 extracellular solute-binding protein [Streptomyces sp. MI02-7b]